LFKGNHVSRLMLDELSGRQSMLKHWNAKSVCYRIFTSADLADHEH